MTLRHLGSLLQLVLSVGEDLRVTSNYFSGGCVVDNRVFSNSIVIFTKIETNKRDKPIKLSSVSFTG